MAKAAQTAKQHEVLILAPFLDIATEDGSALASFMAHCGIDVATSKAPRDQILDHYRLPNGKYDVDLVAAWTRSYAGVNDLGAWERQLSLMSPTSPLWSAAQSEVRRLRADYGLDSAGTEG